MTGKPPGLTMMMHAEVMPDVNAEAPSASIREGGRLAANCPRPSPPAARAERRHAVRYAVLDAVARDFAVAVLGAPDIASWRSPNSSRPRGGVLRRHVRRADTDGRRRREAVRRRQIRPCDRLPQRSVRSERSDPPARPPSKARSAAPRLRSLLPDSGCPAAVDPGWKLGGCCASGVGRQWALRKPSERQLGDEGASLPMGALALLGCHDPSGRSAGAAGRTSLVYRPAGRPGP
jgi:hypothetical protein